MIKIKFQLSDNLYNLEPGTFYNIIIENKEIYRRTALFLFLEFNTDGPISFFNDATSIDAEDICYPMMNVLDLDLNTKKNLNALTKLLKKTYYDSLKDDITNLKEKIINIVKTIALELDINLIASDDIKTDDLFKIMDIRFNDEKETYLEQLINYIFVINELQKKNVFITVHLLEYLEEEDIEMLIKELSYKEIILINIETNQLNKKFASEKTFIIDKDCCFLE